MRLQQALELPRRVLRRRALLRRVR